MNDEYIEVIRGEEIYREIFIEKQPENKLLNFLQKLLCIMSCKEKNN